MSNTVHVQDEYFSSERKVIIPYEHFVFCANQFDLCHVRVFLNVAILMS
jgi:hypothetical protein